MAKKKKIQSVKDLYTVLLEQKLSELNIAFVRKNNGLRLGVYGDLEIAISDTHYAVAVIASVSSNSFNHQSHVQHLIVNYGDIENPSHDPTGPIERLAEILKCFLSVMDLADNKGDMDKIRLITPPSSTAKAAVTKQLNKYKETVHMNLMARISRGNAVISYSRNGTYDGRTRMFDTRVRVEDIRMDANGNFFGLSPYSDEYIPLEDCIEDLIKNQLAKEPV